MGGREARNTHTHRERVHKRESAMKGEKTTMKRGRELGDRSSRDTVAMQRRNERAHRQRMEGVKGERNAMRESEDRVVHTMERKRS